ncbi:MAG: SPOR domain-containing protein [Gammaproteobacteria bacterium]|nr:SPOR domain-containing protein [Gammaproteobacteria bacterium]PCH64253.1 MAG: SPOR domain-containing protein [Gammaproteobacteria bacterium]
MRSRLQFFHNARLVSAQYSLSYVTQSMDSLVTMAASKPTTRKKQARRSTSQRKKPTPPWVWLIIGLMLGLIAALAVYLYTRTDTLPGSIEVEAPAKAKPAAKQKPTASKPKIAKKPRFDFYELLPEREIIIPDEEITSSNQTKKSAPIPDSDKGGNYLLQAGAFKTFKQADQLKARLALIGVEAKIETVKINDAVAWHRVRVGPFNGLDKVNTVRYRLQDNDISTVVLKVN